MYSLNKVQLIGNLTRPPESRAIDDVKTVAAFSIATNEYWKDKNGNSQGATSFHDIIAWNGLAKVIQMVGKGEKVYIEGKLQTRSWEAPDGTNKFKTEIIAQNIILLGKKGKKEEQQTPDTENVVIDEVQLDELPY